MNVISLSLLKAQKYGSPNPVPTVVLVVKSGDKNPDCLLTVGSG